MLPELEPNFTMLSDADLVGLIAYCEKCSHKDVYNTAYAQVFSKKQEEEVKKPFTEWISVGEQKLPPIVREELLRAARINFDCGNMNKLKLLAQLRELIKNQGFWIFILIIIWFWL